MEGDEEMDSDFSSYYLPHQRGFLVGNLAPRAGGTHDSHSGFRPMQNQGPIFPPHLAREAPAMSNPLFMEAPLPAPSTQQHTLHPARKRGRPRKYGPDVTASAKLSPMSSSQGSVAASASRFRPESARPSTTLASGDSSPKKRRGRPPGTGTKQQLATFGDWFANSACSGFTPHVLMVEKDEDVLEKLLTSFSPGPRALCVLTATGAVKRATFYHSDPSRNLATHTGSFDILSLSGSYFWNEVDGEPTRSGSLTVTLIGYDGLVIGGPLGGALIAESTVQIIAGSFLHNGAGSKVRLKSNAAAVEAADPEKAGGSNQTIFSGDRNATPSWN